LPWTRFFDGSYSKCNAACRIVSLFRGLLGVFGVDNQGRTLPSDFIFVAKTDLMD